MNFVAQSLDNDAPMIVASGRTLFSEGDQRRSQVLDETSVTSGRGVKTFITEDVLVYEHKGVFALKLYPKTSDAEGRKAPILCSTRVEQVEGEYWPEVTLQDVAYFAEASGRPLDDDLCDAVLDGLREIKKKVASHHRTRAIIMGALTIIILVILAVTQTWRMSP